MSARSKTHESEAPGHVARVERTDFVRIHQTIRCSPAMEAGVTDKLWSLDDMIRIVDEWEASQKVAQ